MNCSTLSPNCAVLKCAAHSAHNTMTARLTPTAHRGDRLRARGVLLDDKLIGEITGVGPGGVGTSPGMLRAADGPIFGSRILGAAACRDTRLPGP